MVAAFRGHDDRCCRRSLWVPTFARDLRSWRVPNVGSGVAVGVARRGPDSRGERWVSRGPRTPAWPCPRSAGRAVRDGALRDVFFLRTTGPGRAKMSSNLSVHRAALRGVQAHARSGRAGLGSRTGRTTSVPEDENALASDFRPRLASLATLWQAMPYVGRWR
jgi:hypothetical protein